MDLNGFTQTFTKKSFKDRLKDTGYLIKHSFTIIGKDEDIKTPMIKMAIYTTVIRILFFSSILTFLTIEQHQMIGLVALTVLFWLILGTIVIPLQFFYDVRQKANLSWIVYNTLCGKDISFQDAVDHTKPEKGKLRVLGFGELALKYSKTFKKDSGFLINLLLGALTEVWDLLSHFMLPSVVIERKKLKEIVPDLKSLRENVPATLTGVFGLDFAGNAINALMWGLYFVLFIISVVIGWLLTFVTDFGTIVFDGNASFSINWIPIWFIIFILSIVSGIYGKLVASIKVIYFTVFYTSIKQPENIADDMKKDLTHYLLLGDKEE